jgi:YD repeat-containing protein
MKRLWFLFFVLCSSSAFADDHYYYIFTGVIQNSADGVHYPTPDAACQVDYNIMEAWLYGAGYTVPSPYTPPTLYYSVPPNTVVYKCDATATDPQIVSQPLTATASDSIQQQGDNCTDAQTFDPRTGLCENSTDDQSRKELGNSDNIQASGGVLICKGVGDPINAAMGNQFESETDYQDPDGELSFTRNYNSTTGNWAASFEPYLQVSSNVLQVYFDDGHSSLFKLNNGVATAEPTELGRLDQVNGQWVYTSPANEQFTFDANGHLIKRRQANGLVQTLAYVTASDYSSSTVTVTDSRGHTMVLQKSNYGRLTQLTAGDLTVAYTWVMTPNYILQLTQVASTRAGHTGTRTYAYGDTRNPAWLTSITDERGIQYASWTYDSQGRATSSQHAGQADQTTVTYNSDGTSTVTNALGHNVTYTYQVIQGVKRITAIQGEPTASCPASNSTYTYTDRGQVATQTNAMGHVTAYTYDSQGRVLTKVEAQGTPQERTTTTTWDTTWSYLPKTVTTPDNTTTYAYDGQGRLLSTTVHSTKE